MLNITLLDQLDDVIMELEGASGTANILHDVYMYSSTDDFALCHEDMIGSLFALSNYIDKTLKDLQSFRNGLREARKAERIGAEQTQEKKEV